MVTLETLGKVRPKTIFEIKKTSLLVDIANTLSLSSSKDNFGIFCFKAIFDITINRLAAQPLSIKAIS